jgi:O-antigen/teichoic acid export membrane protein
MHRQGDVYGLKNLARNSSAILTFYVVPAGVVAALNAERIMTVFGQDFKRGAIVLIVLLVGVVINVATGAINELLVMTGFEIDVKWVNFMGALLLVIFGPLMLFAWGVVGVAVALSMTFVFVNLAMLILVKKRLGFWAIAMPGHKYK